MSQDLARELEFHKRITQWRVVSGFGLMLMGLFLRIAFIGPAVTVIGAFMCARGLSRLIRISAAQRNIDWYRTYTEFNRASLPRQLFLLLLGVAEVDGQPGTEERDLVRRFIMERFSAQVSAADLQTWESGRVPANQLNTLSNSLRKVLTPAERETVFFWCCQITFVDGSFRADEHTALHSVAKGLGIPAQHARVVFHHAKARHLGQNTEWSNDHSTSRPRTPTSARAQALATLGLEGSPGKDQVRKRHRELVKRYHPDAHNHLGPVAAEEAAKRFREIQSAYELLTEGT